VRWTLNLLREAPAARCLDGSPGAFYLRPPATGNSTNNRFVIFLEGGGWCLSPADCVARSYSKYGSSLSYKEGASAPGSSSGYFDPPGGSHLGREFADATLVFVKYCDASSFAGNGAVTLRAKKTLLLGGGRRVKPGGSFQVPHAGRAILGATLDALIARFALGSATEVLLSGCSAGGLAALLAAEFVRERVRAAGAAASLTRFKVLVFSGVFHASAQPKFGHVWRDQMGNWSAMANVHASLGRTCKDRWPGQPWRCVLGLEPLLAVPADVPVFLEQSVLDRWQTGCILGAAAGAFEMIGCSAKSDAWDSCLQFMNPLVPSARASSARRASGRQLPARSCGLEQRRALDGFQGEFAAALVDSAALRRPGYGAFLHACHSHCPGNPRRIALGAANLEAAMLSWWRAAPDVPSADHLHVSCLPGWAALDEQLVSVERRLKSGADAKKACRAVCPPLYPWPDGRRMIRARAATVAAALELPPS